MPSSRYNLPNTGMPFESKGETYEGKSNSYEVFESRRYGKHFQRTLTEVENYGNWIEDDGQLIGEYEGFDQDLQGSFIELDLKSELEEDQEGSTRLYLPER